jgi:hypothetical protein
VPELSLEQPVVQVLQLVLNYQTRTGTSTGTKCSTGARTGTNYSMGTGTVQNVLNPVLVLEPVGTTY